MLEVPKMSRFTPFSRGKIWIVDIGPCKRFDIFQLCIWMNSLSNLTAMKCKPFLISDLLASSGSDKRVETRHASLKSFEENNCSRTVRALCSRGFTETFAEKNRSGVVPSCWRGSTFCSAEIWNSLERFVQLEFISRRIFSSRLNRPHLCIFTGNLYLRQNTRKLVFTDKLKSYV